jgi:F-type H+-transporting ATPase subunit b
VRKGETVRKRACVVGLAIVVAGLFATSGIASAQAEPKFADTAAEECYKLLAEGKKIDDCQEAPSPIVPAVNEMIWGSIAFVILLGVMWKFALPSVRNMMEAREQKIRGDLEQAEGAKQEADRVLEQYRAQLADARNEASRILEEARQAADQMRRDLIARAEADAAEVRARAQQDVELATQRATAELQRRVADLSIELAEVIVKHNLDRDTQLQLIENYINEVGTAS